MSDNSQDTSVKTRPDQLMPTGRDEVIALQGFLQVMGFDPNGVDGTVGDDTRAAYARAREQYSFLPELPETINEDTMNGVFRSIDHGLQENVAFMRQYVGGVNSNDDDVKALQGALVAGGSWANRHLGDRISDAEAIEIDGNRGVLTDRGVRNAGLLTGVASMQAALNLVSDAGLTPDGYFGDKTNAAMQAYATEKGIELTGDAQANYDAVRQYIINNEGDNLRARVADALNSDQDTSAPDVDTLSAQIVMNEFARQAGSDLRTAPDSRQTDSRITAEMSHTRNVIAPEVGVDLDGVEPTLDIVVRSYVDHKYEVVRNDVVNSVQSIIDQQAANPDYPAAVLAYSAETNGYLLVVRDQGVDESTVYQISDRNVDMILGDVENGSIALDVSAQRNIAEELHGNRTGTATFTTDELRTAFVEDATRFTRDTKENLLTTRLHAPDGSLVTFGLDDFHDGLDHMDSKHDWDGFENPEQIRDYVRELRQAAEDAREERPVTIPVWQHGTLDDTNSVEVDLGGDQLARIPNDIFFAVTRDMERTETGFDFASNNDRAATRVRTYDIDGESTLTDVQLASSFDAAIVATEPLEAPSEVAVEQGDPQVADPSAAQGEPVQLAEADVGAPIPTEARPPVAQGMNL